MELGKRLRMRRLLKNGRSLIIPMDHPVYFGPVPGLEDPRRLVELVAEAGADGILLGPGALETVADVVGNLAIVLRIDGTHTRLGNHLERTGLIATVEEAARMGVEAVVVNIFVGVENEDAHLAKLGEVATQCRKYGMVLVGEMIPEPLLRRHYGASVAVPEPEERAELIGVAARVGAEIGADLLKINYSGTAQSFRTVLDNATRPILIAGGMKSDSDEAFLNQVREALEAGASGVVAGRNVWGGKDPAKTIRALGTLVHRARG